MIEKLKERLKILEEQRQQIQAVLTQAQGVINKAASELLKMDGQIQEVQYWLKEGKESDADRDKSGSND